MNHNYHAVVSKRKMAIGIPDIEGSTHGHDVIPVKSALKYLEKHGYPDFSALYTSMKAAGMPYVHVGSTKEVGANRVVFGDAVNLVLDKLSKEEASKKVMVIDSEFYSISDNVILIVCVRRRFRRLDWLEGDPPEAPRGICSIWYHGTQQFLRGRRVWLRP